MLTQFVGWIHAILLLASNFGLFGNQTVQRCSLHYFIRAYIIIKGFGQCKSISNSLCE